MSVSMLHDRVLVKLKEKPKRSAGGLWLPETAHRPQELPFEATVIAAGPGKYNEMGKFIETTLKPGDMVIFDRHAGAEVDKDLLHKFEPQIDPEAKYYSLREASVMALLVPVE